MILELWNNVIMWITLNSEKHYIQRTDQDGLELLKKKSRTKFVQCSVDICIIWLCIVFICVSHIIAFCFFCYGSLSIYSSASFIFVFFALLALLFFLSQFVFNAFVYILKLRSTSLILPTLIPFSDSTLSRHLNSCYHYRLIFQQGEGYCVCKYVQSNDQWNCSILLPISISPFPWLPHSTLTFIQALIPGQPFPRSTNIPFSDRPFPHMVISFPVTLFPLTKCWVCKLCNKLFLSVNKGTCQLDLKWGSHDRFVTVVDLSTQSTYRNMKDISNIQQISDKVWNL